MENRLCTSDDLKKSERLHRDLETAARERSRVLVRRDELQEQLEAARLHLYCADALLVRSPQTRIEALKAECARLEALRDKATREAEEPYEQALSAILRHDGQIFSAAVGWLGSFEREYPFDAALVELVQTTRRELERLHVARAPLARIAEVFEDAQARVESWELATPPATGYFAGKHFPTRITLPRISDYLHA